MSVIREERVRAGDRIEGRYEIVRRIGAGGMGTVYEARDLALGRHVALKLLERDDPTAEARMLREAKIVGRIAHPNVVRLFDAGRAGAGTSSQPFLVMELLAGRDLARVIVEEAPVPVARAVRFTLEAAAGVAAAHAKNVVHRDLKPSNLFVRDDGAESVVVLDFGASRAADVDTDALTRTASGIGTPLYSAPEQLADARTADARSDVWALGLVLYELLSGTRPFERPTLAAVGAAIVTGVVPPLRDVPSALDAVVRRCLEKDAARRFGSVSAFARALAPWASAEHVAAVVRAEHGSGDRAAAPASETSVPTEDDVRASLVAPAPPTPAPRSFSKRAAIGAVLLVVALAAVAIAKNGRPPAIEAAATAAPPRAIASEPEPVTETPTLPAAEPIAPDASASGPSEPPRAPTSTAPKRRPTPPVEPPPRSEPAAPTASAEPAVTADAGVRRSALERRK